MLTQSVNRAQWGAITSWDTQLVALSR